MKTTSLSIIALVQLFLMAGSPAFGQANVFPGSGNVGIGTTSQSALLSLGQSTAMTKLALHDPSGNKSMYGLGVVPGAFILHLNGSGARFAFMDRTNAGAELLTILGNGRVGIGTRRPKFFLHVNGNAGKTGGGSWATASDERLKDISRPFTRGLDAIARINPTYYSYEKGNPLQLSSNEEFVGLSAQEVQAAIPEAVGEYQDGYLSVTNDPIIWTMLNAIKELRAEKDAIRAELTETRAELHALRAHLK